MSAAASKSSSRGPLLGGFGRKLLLLLLALLLFVLAAPWLVANTPLRGWVLGRIGAGLGVGLSAKEMKLNWFTPIELSGVTVSDAEGESLAEVERVTTTRSLLGLVCNHRSDIGTFRFEKAALRVAFQGNTSNLEALLSKLPKPENNGGKGPALGIEFVNASVHVHDGERKSDWLLDPVDLELQLRPHEKPPLEGKVRMTAPDARVTGTLEALLTASDDGSAGEISATLNAFPIDWVSPLLRRHQKGLLVHGRLAGEIKGGWTTKDGRAAGTVEGELRGNNCQATGGIFGADRVAFQNVQLPCKMAIDATRLKIEKLGVTCDVGTAHVQGTYDWNRAVWDNLNEPGQSARVDIDIARLAERMPQTLHLHKDLRLTGGRLTARLQSAAHAGGVAWDGELQTSAIQGTRGSQALSWPEPVTFDFRVTDLKSGVPTFERVQCRSNFLNVDGSAKADAIHLKGNLQLDVMSKQLAQFVDFGGTQPAGEVSFQIVCDTKRDAAGQSFQLRAAANLDRFRLVWSGKGWDEPKLIAQAIVQGRRLESGLKSIEQGFVSVQADQDLASVQLYQPITDLSKDLGGAYYVKLNGNLDRWLRRVRPLVPALVDVRLEGAVEAQAWVKLTGAQANIEKIDAKTKNFVCGGIGVDISDPMFDILGAGTVDAKTGTLILKETQVRTTALVVHTNSLFVHTAKGTAIGNLIYQGDLAKLGRWFSDPRTPMQLAGILDGQSSIEAQGEKLVFKTSNSVLQFAMGPPAQPTYRDAKVTLNGAGEVDWTRDRLGLDRLTLVSQFLGCEGKGEITKLASRMEVNASGTLSYDLQKLEPTLKAYLGAGARIEGKDARAFKLAGPLRPSGKSGAVLSLTPLEGDVAVNWKRLAAYGADIGPAEIKARLANGWLNADPIQASLNGGKLRLVPRVHLEPGPIEMHLEKGLAVDQAQITPAMCASALGYALPTLANVAEAEGKLSFELDQARIPLADPTRALVVGTLTMHHAKVGPGAIIKDMTSVLRMPTPYSVITENKIKIRFQDGRIHHDDLRMQFPDNILVRTSGSVGLDGTLRMTAEMPFPKNLITGPLSSAMPKTVTVPIAGTLERPQLDRQALQSILAQSGRNVLENTLQQGIQKGFEKLLPKK